MFSPDEAFEFVERVLEVSSPRSRASSDRKALLDDVVVGIQTHLPFQNIRLLAVDAADRCKPTLEEIKKDILNGYGGLCFQMNITAFFLLQALGFKAVLAHASCTSTYTSENNHVIVYVSDVEKPGDKFIVEVAFGFPTFRAVSFDFKTESPVYRDSFIEFKYLKHGGKLLRMHRKGEMVNTPPDHPCTFILDGWRRFYYANFEGTTDVSAFDTYFDNVFKLPDSSPFHRSFRVIGFPARKAVIVVNQKLLLENGEGDLVPTPIEGGDEGIVQAVKKYYPIFPETLIRQALTNWRKETPA